MKKLLFVRSLYRSPCKLEDDKLKNVMTFFQYCRNKQRPECGDLKSVFLLGPLASPAGMSATTRPAKAFAQSSALSSSRTPADGTVHRLLIGWPNTPLNAVCSSGRRGDGTSRAAIASGSASLSPW